ncbi:BofC C-terminal domain-containing protein [Peribacillus sp. SCS-155]|uniref:BofC C-terminal domain-containing protein n=1 Tax=Peribacillus sedimenti TaxID=3115297 RepID=UPI003906727C
MRKELAFFAALATALITSVLCCESVVADKTKDGDYKEEHVITEPLERKIILQRMYLDGEVSEEIKTEKILSMEDFWAAYEDWQLVDQNEERMVFKRSVNDISPLLKANGFFGITKDGTLTIFNGRPEQERIIHSFYQIDVGKLESSKQAELSAGIPIINKMRYAKVIEAYKLYSVSRSIK